MYTAEQYQLKSKQRNYTPYFKIIAKKVSSSFNKRNANHMKRRLLSFTGEKDQRHIGKLRLERNLQNPQLHDEHCIQYPSDFSILNTCLY